MLLHHVHNENCCGDAGQIRNGTQVLFELGALATHLQALTLGHGGQRSVLFHFVNGAHLADRLANGRKVRQHATGPALCDIGHTHRLDAFCNSLLGLFLGRHKQNFLAAFGNLLHGGCRFIDLDHSLVEVNDVNALLLCEDVGGHVGVPLALEVAVL